jgi:hypothetical protein
MKTLEEIRATNRERQRRWRERHKGYARLRERNVKREARANNATPPVSLTKGVDVPNAIPHYGEVDYGPVEWHGVMEPEGRGGHDRYGLRSELARDIDRGKDTQEGDGAVKGGPGGIAAEEGTDGERDGASGSRSESVQGGGRTAHEDWVDARLAEMMGRKNKRRPGVEVDLGDL